MCNERKLGCDSVAALNPGNRHLQPKSAERSQSSALRRRPNDDVADLDVFGLLDGKGDGTCHRFRLHADLIHGRAGLVFALTSGSVIEAAKSVLTIPGEMPVARRCGPDSSRRPSQTVRTAFFVAA